MDQAITAHAYPPTVWSAGEVVEDQVLICAANLQPPGTQFGWVCIRRQRRSALPWKRARVRFLRKGPGCWKCRLVLDYEQRCRCAGDMRSQ